jgi:carboxyl-terminal processing protease
VSERYWSIDARGVDWDRIGDDYRARALAAADEADFHEVLERMYQELGDDHSLYVPPARVEEIRETYGNLPCLAVLGQRSGEERLGRISYRHYDDIGYLRLPDLASPGIAVDARLAVRSLSEAGVGALVLDIRGNPGGRLVEMMQVAGIFTRGFLWRVLTRWSLPLPYPALGAVETDLPLAVLVDAGVNSAAEGLAGALQRQGRALIVGETTAGNVEAVLPFCLRDGSQAWIATGVLAPIGGPTWEGRGVVPDLITEPDEALEAALRHLRER